MTGLTEAEIDSLTECECGHYANEHSSDGCLATDFSEDWRPIREDDKCSCTHSPTAINRHAIERIKADAVAAARAEVLGIARLAEHLADSGRLLRCEMVAFLGEERRDDPWPESRGRCPRDSVAVKWEDGFADWVCEKHAETAAGRGALMIRPKRHDGSLVADLGGDHA